eukprot:3254227-Rhodomonas_salina.1
MSKPLNQNDMQNMAVAAQKAGEVSQAANQATQQAGGVKVMGGAAAAAGGVGLLVAGPVVGVALAAGAAYATTRSDGVGDSARACGQGVVGTAGKAKAFNEVRQKAYIEALDVAPVVMVCSMAGAPSHAKSEYGCEGGVWQGANHKKTLLCEHLRFADMYCSMVGARRQRT